MVSLKELLFSWTLSLSLLGQTLADPAPNRGISAREFADLAQIYARRSTEPLSTRQNQLIRRRSRARIAHKRSPVPEPFHEPQEKNTAFSKRGRVAQNNRKKNQRTKNRKAKKMSSRPAPPSPAPAPNRQNSRPNRVPPRKVPGLGRQNAIVGTPEGHKKLTQVPKSDK